MKHPRISKLQRDMLGRIIADPRGKFKDTLELWAVSPARTYRSLCHLALIHESHRKSKIGLGRVVVLVRSTPLGKAVYETGLYHP